MEDEKSMKKLLTDKQIFRAGVKQYLAMKIRTVTCRGHTGGQIELSCKGCIVNLLFYFEDMAVTGLMPDGVVLIKREVGPKPTI